MHSSILPPCKLDELGSLTLIWKLIKEKENSEFRLGEGWVLPGYSYSRLDT